MVLKLKIQFLLSKRRLKCVEPSQILDPRPKIRGVYSFPHFCQKILKPFHKNCFCRVAWPVHIVGLGWILADRERESSEEKRRVIFT